LRRARFIPYLLKGRAGDAEAIGLGDAFKSRRDIHAVPHQVAIGLLDDVAKMNSDAQLYSALGRQAGVPLDHAVLYFDGATHSVDHASEFDQSAIARALHHTAFVDCHGGIDQVAANARSRASVRSSSAPASRL
jgi:hypothetical protein